MVLLFGSSLAAQYADGRGARVHYYGVEEGLPHRTVHSAVYDSLGLLWVGTSNGLCRLDGHGVHVMSHLPQRFNGRLQRSESGHLICRVEEFADSLEVFDPITHLVTGLRLAARQEGLLCGVYHAPDRPLYYVLGRRLLRYSAVGGKQTVFRLPFVPTADYELTYADGEGCVFRVGGNDELLWVRADGQTDRYQLPDAGKISLAHYDNCKDELWVGTDAGFYRLARRSGNWTRLPDLPSGKPVNRMWQDRSGNRIYGHLDEIMQRFDDLVFDVDGRLYNGQWLLAMDNRIIEILGDDFSRQIILSTHGGLRTLHFSTQQAGPFRRYLYDPAVPPGRFGDVMRGFAEDEAGNVYVNKDSRMPYWFRVDAETEELDTLLMRNNQGGVVEHWGCGSNLLAYRGYVYGHSCTMEPGRVRRGRIYRYDPAADAWRNWALPHPAQVIRWIIPDRQPDHLLVFGEDFSGEDTGHLYRFSVITGHFSRILPVGPEEGLAGQTRGVRYDERRGVYWLGTAAGLYRFDPATERLNRYLIPGKQLRTVTDLLFEPDGRLLVGTLRAGLFHFDPEQERFGPQVGRRVQEDERQPLDTGLIRLPGNDVANLLRTPAGQTLITTFQGLVWQDGDRTSVFTEDHGLPDNEFNSSSLYYAAKTDRYYAGGINGFASFRTEDLADPRSPYRAVLLSYRLLDDQVGYETTHRLPATADPTLVLDPTVVYCALEFTLPDFSAPGQQRYQTRLVNYDPDWTPLGKDNSVRYTRLPPGDYRFELRAYDAARRRSANVVTLPLKVLTPWYEQGWFRLLLVVTLALISRGLINLRLRQVKSKMETERRLQSLELRSLRQQLNPHFISNALNAIKEYIPRNDAAEAASYLTDFSRLMRQFLESSRSRFTPLAKEIAMLKRYVRLEQLRFPGKFEATITVGPDLDPAMDTIPSFLLQPLVENAIQHGLRPLAGGGLLRVDFSLDPAADDVLVCTVADNGVGRRNAAAKEVLPGRQSRATHIMDERQAMLAATDDVRLDISVEDQFPDRPEQPGTVVRIRISGGEG